MAKRNNFRNIEIQKNEVRDDFFHKRISITSAYNKMLGLGYGNTRAYQIVNGWNEKFGFIAPVLNIQGLKAR